MKYKLALAVMLFASVAYAQVASVSVYCPPMPVLKKGVGLWQCQLEPTDVTIKYPSGVKTMLAKKPRLMKMGSKSAIVETGDIDIPATYVRGVFRRAVDPCVGTGKLDDGSEFTMKLPREPVILAGFERVGFLKREPIIIAVAMDAEVVVVKKNGDKWIGFIRFPDCRTHQVSRWERLAEEVTAIGTIQLTKP